MEEIAEAQHAELMSYAALPRHLMKQRDSLLSLQNVESLTDELAQLSQDLERLTTSEGATISDSPVSTIFYIGNCVRCVCVLCAICDFCSIGKVFKGSTGTSLVWAYFSKTSNTIPPRLHTRSALTLRRCL